MSNAFDLRWIVLPIAVALLAVGLWLLVRGLRGRRVGVHPTCSRCGFDLRGAPEGSSRCPECGSDTTAPNAVRVGFRHRRPWLVGAGAVLLLAAVLGVAASAARIDRRSLLPTWYVLYEARSGSPRSRVAPIDQLLSRDAATPLNAYNRLALVRAIIVLQRDPSNVAKPAWGDFVAGRLIDGSLPAADRDAFVANLLADYRVTLRPKVGAGQRWPLQIEVAVRGGGLASPLLGARIDSANRSLVIDGRTLAPRPTGALSSWQSLATTGGGTSTFGTSEGDPILTKLPIGPHRVEWTLPVPIHAGASGGPEVARGELRWSGTVEVVAPGTQARLVPDPTKAAAVRAAIESATLTFPEKPKGSMRLNLTLASLPVDVAFDIFVRQGDGPEKRLTTMQRKAGQNPTNMGFSFDLPPELRPGTATLIFRPSVEAAAGSVDLFDIWDGEIRLDDVPVVRE